MPTKPAVATLVVLGALALAACGDDSSDAKQDAVGAPSPAPTGPVILGKGLIPGGVTYDSDGPAVFSVRTVTIPPGGTTGWHTHDGTETSLVTKGELTFVRKGACKPVVIGPGDGLFVPDGAPHMARNDGDVPAEAVVTYLLKPDAPDRADAPAAC